MGQVMWLLWLLQLLTGVDCWSGAKQLNSPHNLHMTGCYGDSVYMKVYHGDSKSQVTRPPRSTWRGRGLGNGHRAVTLHRGVRTNHSIVDYMTN